MSRYTPVPPAAFLLFALTSSLAPRMGAQSLVARPEWQAVFDSAGLRGVFVVRRVGESRLFTSDTVRARRRYLPASTFKIPNSLIALETGVVRDERHLFPMTWPTQDVATWNRAQTLSTALKYSVVPVYQIIARQIGEPRYRHWLEKLDYGNRDPGGGVDHFWLDGALRVSAVDQVDFLGRLASGSLPLSERSQRIVQAMLIRDANDSYRLHAKTGLVDRDIPPEERIGWYVGWVETDTASWVFALNVAATDPAAAAHRISITRQLLARAGAIPSLVSPTAVNTVTINQDWAQLHHYAAANAQLGSPAAGEDRVVFFGNSITEAWAPLFPAMFPGKPYVGRGISGQTTPQMLVRFRQDVIALQPKVVVILAGTNDIAGNTGPSSIEMIEDNLRSMTELAQANGIRVVLSSVLPVYEYPWKTGLNPAPKIVALNAWMRRYAEGRQALYLDYHTAMRDSRDGLPPDLATDGVHPTAAGYRLMAPLAVTAITEALRQP